MWDNCAACEEKNVELEYLSNQLDSIRLIVEEGKVKGILPRIMDVLEG